MDVNTCKTTIYRIMLYADLGVSLVASPTKYT